MESRHSVLRFFERFDSGGTGKITVEDLRVVFQHLGVDEATLDTVFREADKNGDGLLDYSEFLSWLDTGGAANAKGRIIVFAGPPAAGKGTQCKRLAAEFGFVHISVGDIYRDAAARGTELGRRAQADMDRGDFVSDDITISLIEERLACPDVNVGGCFLDGFPRTPVQAAALVARWDVERLLLLDLAEDASVERALARRLDPETGAIYNIDSMIPPADVVDRLITRSNDVSEDIVRNRLRIYAQHLQGIVAEFGHKVQQVDASPGPDAVFDSLLSLIAGPPPKDDGGGGEDDWSDDEPPGVLPLQRAISTIDPTALVVAPCAEVGDGGDVCVAVSIDAPQHPDVARAPADICCLVDISGSMRTKASFEVDGVMKDDGLSLLDIAKHAVKTVIHMLDAEDRFTLVAFDNKAEVVFPLSLMTVDGKAEAVAALQGMLPRGATYLWTGIHASMEALRTPIASASPRHKTIFLLTDGLPSDAAVNHVAQVKAYQEDHPDFHFQMNTFGFGYKLDSALLHNLASESHGTYSFVPDALILGTCFVNSVSNVLTTLAQTSKIHLTAKGGAELIGPVLGDYPFTDTSWGRVVDLGPLSFGQRREIVVPMRLPPGAGAYLGVTLEYGRRGGNMQNISMETSNREVSIDARMAENRCDVVSTVYDVLRLYGSGVPPNSALEAVVQRVQSRLADNPDPRLAELEKDVSGRMTKAIQGAERFNRWGKHYLRALTRAHQVQICTNFMDPGLQVYGGARFKECRALGDEVFVSLPMPRPSQPAQPKAQPAAKAAAPARQRSPSPPTARAYYGGGGGG